MVNELFQYIMELPTDEARVEAITALSPEVRDELTQFMFHKVNGMVRQIIDNKEEIWETGELPAGVLK